MNNTDPLNALPEDLNALLTELGVSPSDAKIKFLLCFRKDLNQIKDLLESARPGIAAVLDNRLERMKQWADSLASVDKRLNEILEHFETKPLKIKEQVEQELLLVKRVLITSRFTKTNLFPLLQIFLMCADKATEPTFEDFAKEIPSRDLEDFKRLLPRDAAKLAIVNKILG